MGSEYLQCYRQLKLRILGSSFSLAQCCSASDSSRHSMTGKFIAVLYC